MEVSDNMTIVDDLGDYVLELLTKRFKKDFIDLKAIHIGTDVPYRYILQNKGYELNIQQQIGPEDCRQIARFTLGLTDEGWKLLFSSAVSPDALQRYEEEISKAYPILQQIAEAYLSSGKLKGHPLELRM